MEWMSIVLRKESYITNGFQNQNVLIFLKFGHFHVNSKKLGVQAPEKVKFK